MDTSWNGQIKRGRYATIVLSLLLALYVSRWSYELYGRKGALLSLSLVVFDPNLLAHGELVTADLPAALMTTMALYHFWQFLKFGGKGRALLSAVALGLSQLAKYSCIYLYPIFLVIAVLYGTLQANRRNGRLRPVAARLSGAPSLVSYDGVFRCGEHSHNQPWIRFRWNRDALVGICVPLTHFSRNCKRRRSCGTSGCR